MIRRCIIKALRSVADAIEPTPDVFICRYCKRKVDFMKPYHSDGNGLWHWECP